MPFYSLSLKVVMIQAISSSKLKRIIQSFSDYVDDIQMI